MVRLANSKRKPSNNEITSLSHHNVTALPTEVRIENPALFELSWTDFQAFQSILFLLKKKVEFETFSCR